MLKNKNNNSKHLFCLVHLFGTVWHAKAFVRVTVLDVTQNVRYYTAKACDMTQYCSEKLGIRERSYMTILTAQKGIHINRLS